MTKTGKTISGGARRAACRAVVLGVASVLAAACSPTHHRLEARREAREALAARRPHVPEAYGALDPDAADAAALRARSTRAVSLDLAQALRFAAEASRDHRERRERAYLAALALANARHDYGGRFRVGGTAEVAATGDGDVEGAVTPGLSFARLLEAGGSLVVDLATAFVHAFRGDPVSAAQSLLSADLVLPLGRGGGAAGREALTQAEREVLYALRDFARFQQEFVVAVASDFYGVLEARDTLANEERALDDLQAIFGRARELGPDGAGRLPDFEVDEARQDLLRAGERTLRARQAYERALDDFKQRIGLPTGARLEVVDETLAALRERGLPATEADARATVGVALGRRLDLRNARDRVEDARRRVAIAEDALGPGLDVLLGGSVRTPSRRPFDVADGDVAARAGLAVDLPFDRRAERTDHRASEIDLLAARRDVEALEDSIVASVRDAWRSLETARRSYQNQAEAVRVALGRSESADMSFDAGRADARDVLFAQEALVESRNLLTRALVEHAVARMELERDTGTLDVARWLALGRSAGPARADRPILVERTGDALPDPRAVAAPLADDLPSPLERPTPLASPRPETPGPAGGTLR
jgi:outer membrane protein TolC